MIWRIENFTDEKIASMEKDHYSIHHLHYSPKIERFILQNSFPPTIYRNLYLLTIPEAKQHLYLTHYKLIQETTLYLDSFFSFDDFSLAYIAAELNWGVVSYDHHLLKSIQKFLEFTAFYPAEVANLPSYSMVLLDSNIFFSYIEKGSRNKAEILRMFQENPTKTFLIPATIIEEILRVNRSHSFQNRIAHESYLEPDYTSLTEYVDNFEGFASFNATRKIQKKNQKIGSSHSSDRLHGRWGKCLKRF